MLVAESRLGQVWLGKAIWTVDCGAVQFVYDMERFDADKLLKMIEKYKLATFCAPPTIYRFLIQQDLSNYDLSSLVHCSTAGEPLNPQVFYTFEKATGLKILNGFWTIRSTDDSEFRMVGYRSRAMGKPNPFTILIL